MKKLICILMVLIPTLLFAQEGKQTNSGNVRKDRPWGISACLGGGNLLGVSLDYFAIPQINIEVGFGYSQYIALKYHFAGGEAIKWSPYVGFGYGMPIASIREADYRFANGVMAVPLGVHYIHKGGFSFSIECILGIVHYREYNYSYNYYYRYDVTNETKTDLFPSMGLRLGYHF